MSYSLDKVQKEFKEACQNAGTPCTAPIKINKRLTRTVGRVTQHFNQEKQKYEPVLVEFSEKLLKTATDASIKDVILHEASHYIITSRTGELHSHDSLFQAVCKEIGTSNDTSEADIQRTVPQEALYKYSVFCSNCGEFLGGFQRQCKTLKLIANKACSCKLCGSYNLKTVQNW